MDGIATKLTAGNPAALRLVKSMITNPMLINTDANFGAAYAISLECETCQESGSAEVSESLIINQGHKVNVSDNVAPGSWTWTLSGYIPGNKALEPTNYYTPVVAFNTDILRNWFKKGAVLIFKDWNLHVFKTVVIKDFTTSQKSDCANKTPFSMTLKELNVMEEMSATSALKSIATEGSALGDIAKLGSVTATVVAGAAAIASLL